MSAPSAPVELVLSKVKGCKQERNGFAALCPAHEDRHPSLAITQGEHGRCLLHCRAGCDTQDIVQRLGLTMSDLMAKDYAAHTPPSASHSAFGFTSARDGAAAYCKQLGKYAARWVYRDTLGAPIGVVLRWNFADGKKTFRGLWLLDGRWQMSPAMNARPLFQLNALGSEARVFVVEGEKCAQMLASLGCVATTSSGGARAAEKSDWEPLAGREVILLPDEDTAGTKYIDDVRRACEALTPPARVSTLRLKELAHESGHDVVDWVHFHHGGDSAAARDDLVQRADAAVNAIEEAADALADSVSLLSLLADPDAMKPPRCVASGFAGFDQAQPWNAVEEGAKVLWGGEPGTGKTRCLLALALGYARNGHRVVYALGEMSPRQMMRRALLMQAGLGNAALLNPLPQHSAKLATGATTLREFAENLRFIQQPLRFESIARAAVWADVVFIDPLQSVRAAATFEARHEELDALMHHIVQLSAKERTVFQMASEIGKPEGNAERTLQTAFKGSSALVQYADAAYLLKQESGGVQDVVCLKQREGERHAFAFHIGTGGLQLTAPVREGGAR